MSTRLDDEAAIRALIDRWAAAVRRRDYEGIVARHSPDILMFDVPPPYQSKGLDAYRRTWDLFYSWMTEPVVFDVSDVAVTAGADVAFATARGRCVQLEKDGSTTPLDFRLTVGLRKLDGEWSVEHEHHSLPAET